MTRLPFQKALAFICAFMLIGAVSFGAVSFGAFDQQPEQAEPIQSAEAIGPFAAPAAVIAVTAGAAVYDEYFDDGDFSKTAAEQADAEEAEVSIYKRASTQEANSRVLLEDGMQSHLQDTEEIARMEGMQQYVRELENGSTEASARVAAKEAVIDYYADRQMTVFNSWEIGVTAYQEMRDAARTHTGVSDEYVFGNFRTNDNTYVSLPNITGVSDTSYTLVNDSTTTTLGLDVYAEGGGTADDIVQGTVTPDQNYFDNGASPEYIAELNSLDVQAPNDNYERLGFHDINSFITTMDEIRSQKDQAVSDLDTVINNTFDQYQAGDLNVSDFVDPYLGAREYSPEEDFGTWSQRMLSSVGVTPPENFDNFGRMEIRDIANGNIYEGVMLSDGQPSGGFEVGTTYNATNIGGPQFVMVRDNQQLLELEGEFKIANATTADGTTFGDGEKVKYTNVTYDTANVDEFQQEMDRLKNLTAQIEARQDNIRGGGDGGGGGAVFGGGNESLVILIVALLAVAAIVRDGNGGSGGRRGGRR